MAPREERSSRSEVAEWEEPRHPGPAVDGKLPHIVPLCNTSAHFGLRAVVRPTPHRCVSAAHAAIPASGTRPARRRMDSCGAARCSADCRIRGRPSGRSATGVGRCGGLALRVLEVHLAGPTRATVTSSALSGPLVTLAPAGASRCTSSTLLRPPARPSPPSRARRRGRPRGLRGAAAPARRRRALRSTREARRPQTGGARPAQPPSVGPSPPTAAASAATVAATAARSVR